MRALRDRLLGLSCTVAALLLACSVFPDEAVLPLRSAGVAGGEGGEASAAAVGGSVTAGSVSEHAGGEGGGQAGAGGVLPERCATPAEDSVSATSDSWIGSAAPSVNHGNEAQLFVSGGEDERRALFAFMVPTVPAGAELLSAEVVLTLESNADATLAARRLSLRRLERVARDDKVTWTHFAQGQNTWTTPGGDLGEVVAEASVPAGTSSGSVRFDVTDAVLRASPGAYGLAVLETGDSPPAPAQLAFTSRESKAAASRAPTLVFRYCQP